MAEDRILGVETGACPHTAVREDPSMNLAAVEDMETKFPDTDLVIMESGGDNLTLTFNPALVELFRSRSRICLGSECRAIHKNSVAEQANSTTSRDYPDSVLCS